MSEKYLIIGKDTPKRTGEYCITSERIRTFIAQYATYDGEKWINIPSLFIKVGGTLYFIEDEGD